MSSADLAAVAVASSRRRGQSLARIVVPDEASKLGETWYHETYEDFTALLLVDPKTSGETSGPNPFGRLSAHGRWFVESMDAAPDIA